jgi:hypothetical protein
MKFKIKDRVLRVLNIKTKDGYLQETIGRKSYALCSFRGLSFMAPDKTMVYQRASITRGSKEYLVLWYISGLQTSVYLNTISNTTGTSVFEAVTDDQEFKDLMAFIVSKKLDRIEVGDEVPYVVEENPLGF